MSRKLLLPLLALCAIIAVAPATASAATAHASYSHKKQDTYIKKLRTSVRGIGKAIALFTSTDKKQNANITAILGGVPDIVSGLTQLKDGLTKLGDAYQAVEYGALGVYVGSNTSPVGGVRLVSADIPDDGNTAAVSGSIPSGNPGGASTSMTIKGRAAIRSAEADGKTATGPPVGEVGALIYAVCAGSPTSLTCGAVPSGGLLCAGRSPANTYSLPDGTSTSQNLVPIQLAVSRLDQSAPGAALPENGGTGTDTRSDCTIPVLGGPGPAYSFIVVAQAQFADIPDSTSPGPKD